MEFGSDDAGDNVVNIKVIWGIWAHALEETKAVGGDVPCEILLLQREGLQSSIVWNLILENGILIYWEEIFLFKVMHLVQWAHDIKYGSKQLENSLIIWGSLLVWYKAYVHHPKFYINRKSCLNVWAMGPLSHWNCYGTCLWWVKIFCSKASIGALGFSKTFLRVVLQ